MSKLVVRSFGISLDGFSAAPGQSMEAPFGKDGLKLMNWVFPTKYFNNMIGKTGGIEGMDNDILSKQFENIGANIMGHNMFGPPIDAKNKETWKGWWGENPPYHSPVFILSHQKKASIDMEGGTSFTFVTDGIESALQQAFAAAKGKDVRLNGGAATVRQYLKAGLIDELHLVQVPMLMGQGERIFEDLGGVEDLYECVKFTPSELVSHLFIVKKSK
jgi:dihydrofolate reductase